MKENKIVKTVKQIATVTLSVGVGAIIGNAVRFTSPASMGLLMKGCVGLSSLVLGGMVSDKATDYADAKIDEAAEEVAKIVEESKETTTDDVVGAEVSD